MAYGHIVQIAYSPGSWTDESIVLPTREEAECAAAGIAKHRTGGRAIGFAGIMYSTQGYRFKLRIKELEFRQIEPRRVGITRATVATPVLRKASHVRNG
jgi:hypothetical protein